MNFDDFHKWVHKEYGINLSAYKPEQLNRRINSLMGRVGVENLDQYKQLLLKNEEQKNRFIDFITINVTEFFRNPDLFNELDKVIEKELLNNNKRIKIWSAACSIGCEPYSVAMLLREKGYSVNESILATDIDRTILKKAQLGIYEKNEMKNVADRLCKKYFMEENEKFKVDNTIKSMVKFKQHDLIQDNYDNDYDLIICRNVVIYFKNEVKNEVFTKFSNSLKPGGLLFVGATESIYNYKEYGLDKVSTFIYRKL